MPIEPIEIAGREVPLHKAAIAPTFGIRNVLTNSPWTFVELWMRRHKQLEALVFWDQARSFFNASVGLPVQSSPLLLYYCYMNATKALLATKGIAFTPKHGITAHNMRGPTSKISLSNEGVRLLQNGIARSLSGYYLELDQKTDYSLQDLFYNMVFIHRSYCLTYTSQQEMFVPLGRAEYVRDSTTGEVFLRATLTSDIPWENVRRRMPQELGRDERLGRRGCALSCERALGHPHSAHSCRNPISFNDECHPPASDTLHKWVSNALVC